PQANGMLTNLSLDLRDAIRTFLKQPAFAATAVLTLALGIGATTAIFSVVYGVLLKPLPFSEPERLEGLLVSASTLPLLRIQPIAGNGFTAEDDTPGHPLRVILTYGYWQR